MKRIAGLALVVLLIMGVLGYVGAYAEAGSVAYNAVYNEDEMQVIGGAKMKISPDECLGDKYAGFMFMPPDVWKEATGGVGTVEMGSDDYSAMVDYVPEEYGLKMEKLAPEDDAGFVALLDEIYQNSCKVLCVYRVNKSSAESQEQERNLKPLYAHIEFLGEFGDDSYYFAYNDTFDERKLSEGDKASLQALKQGLPLVKDTLMLFPAVPSDDAPADLSGETGSEEGDFKADMTAFTAKDLAGKEYTQDMFAAYDLTMVNVWATWCGPCVGELPDLAKLAQQLPKNVNMISICADGGEESDLAKESLESAKAGFTTLIPSDELNSGVLDHVFAYPTTFFVDSAGRLVGGEAGLQVGVPEDAAKGYMDLMEKNLKALGK